MNQEAAKKSPLGLDVELLQSTLKVLVRRRSFVKNFYNKVFEEIPAARRLFANTDMVQQQKKLLGVLKTVVGQLHNPDAMIPQLKALGRLHGRLGVTRDDYDAVNRLLLAAMKEAAGEMWSEECQIAWGDALNTVASIMQEDHHEDNGTMAVNTKERSGITAGHAEDELAKVRGVLENAFTPMMMIDRDLVITYVNKATVRLLQENEETLAKIYPRLDLSKLVGTCIDVFHANPSHQRQLLSRPENLPYSTDIEVGPLTFRINVTAMYDSSGEYIGNSLEWMDVSRERAHADASMRTQAAVDNAITAIMMIDRDLKVTYANKATVRMLKKYEAELRSLYPGFSADRLVGSCIDDFHSNPAHQRKLLSDPANLPYETDIHVGPLTFHINVTAITDAAGRYVGNSMEWEDVTEKRAKDEEIARLQSAVDGATTNIMLANTDFEITYANPAVLAMLRQRQSELRKVFPGLDVDNLVGTCIDVFHKNPSHQRALLSNPDNLPAKAEIDLGDVQFEVNATAVVDSEGGWLGNMVEWKDITEQKDAEKQIARLIEAASQGDLESRLDSSRYEGFMASLSEGINTLLNAVVEPLRESTRVIKSMSDGDLSQTMTGDFQGDFKSLQDALNATVSNLKDMVVRIREAASTITTGASEISQGNQDLSQRTEEQASSLEETASSMEELTSTVKQNADNARQANQLAAGARDQAEKGGEVVSNAVSAMAEINDSSKKIADIIGVIDEIAFQTNLLALNAAVEAARAGEQGRGFAVVATEVRNLAQRSAAAAKEIKTLIKDSVEKVEDGTKLVDESGSTLEEIVNAVKKVSDIIAEIAAASQEQSSGIEQVNKAVMQMDEVTQQNAALVEEAASASESMDEQAKELVRLVSFFKIGNDESPLEPPAAPRRAASAALRPAANRGGSSAPARRQPSASSDADGEWAEF
ncbi:MAG TPA: PAS domain-containing protein [Gammaproteobacteria bacterium]|nr:PAS domain-containing protein [Gammaproteobacteria bacterium]